uniref:Uncharacterized protein n=1 Tax=Dunaliella tertiolecta TaxID=3047 RepID=A0A7S3QPZ4_DUNTE
MQQTPPFLYLISLTCVHRSPATTMSTPGGESLSFPVNPHGPFDILIGTNKGGQGDGVVQRFSFVLTAPSISLAKDLMPCRVSCWQVWHSRHVPVMHCLPPQLQLL